VQLVKGNTFAGTAFFSYGGFWMAYFLLQYVVKVDKANFVGAAGFEVGETLFLCLWGVFTALFFVPTLRKNHCLMVVFSSLSVTFFLLAGGVWSPECHKAAGYVGFVCGCSAIYTAIAEIYEESLGINMPGLRAVRYL
jgi:succinate-acetate transporter protein